MINSPSRTTAHRALAAAGLLASGAMLLTACSSSSTAGSGASASASAGSAAGSGMSAYRTCLSQHGVTLPSGRPSGGYSYNPSAPHPSHSGGYGGGYGGFGGGASANPTMAAAMQACASLRPKGGGFGGGKGLGGTALAAFTSCMKDNGVTVNAAGGGLGALLKSTDAKTVAALKVCKPLLPTRGGAAPSASPSA